MIIVDIFIIALISCWWKISSFDHWRDKTKHFPHSQTTFYMYNPRVLSCPIHPHIHYTIICYFDVNLVLNRQFISLLRIVPVIKHWKKICEWNRMVCDCSLSYIHDLTDRFSAMYSCKTYRNSPYLAYCNNNKENLMTVKNPSEE